MKKKLIPLAFVPISDVIEGLDVVADEFDDEDLLDYFEKTWRRESKKRGKLSIY